jgi:hypothetical protein
MSRDGPSSANIDGMPIVQFASITGVPVGFLIFRRELGDAPYEAAAMWRLQRLKEIRQEDCPSGVPSDEQQRLRAVAERMVERMRQEDKDGD